MYDWTGTVEPFIALYCKLLTFVPEIPESGTDVARRATRATATAATSVSVQRVLGGEGQLREVTARQVTLDDDELTTADAAEYATSAECNKSTKGEAEIVLMEYLQFLKIKVGVLINIYRDLKNQLIRTYSVCRPTCCCLCVFSCFMYFFYFLFKHFVAYSTY